jgi:hypothetical protein
MSILIAFWKMYERAYETYEYTLFWYAHEHAHKYQNPVCS